MGSKIWSQYKTKNSDTLLILGKADWACSRCNIYLVNQMIIALLFIYIFFIQNWWLKTIDDDWSHDSATDELLWFYFTFIYNIFYITFSFQVKTWINIDMIWVSFAHHFLKLCKTQSSVSIRIKLVEGLRIKIGHKWCYCW